MSRSSGWNNLNHDQRVSQLIDALVLNEMGVADRQMAFRHTEVRLKPDPLDRMEFDLEVYWPRIEELRQEGRLSSVETIKAQAEAMVDLSSDDMRKEFARLSREAKTRLEQK